MAQNNGQRRRWVNQANVQRAETVRLTPEQFDAKLAEIKTETAMIGEGDSAREARTEFANGAGFFVVVRVLTGNRLARATRKGSLDFLDVFEGEQNTASFSTNRKAAPQLPV